jgi:hypothetical protein
LSELRLCSSSVADPGCFIPDPGSGSDHCSIPDPGGKKAPDPGSRIRPLFLQILFTYPGSRIRPLLHPGSRIRIPDPGGKKAPDPGSRIRIRNTVLKIDLLLQFKTLWHY